MRRLAYRALCGSLVGDEVCSSVTQRMAGFGGVSIHPSGCESRDKVDCVWTLSAD